MLTSMFIIIQKKKITTHQVRIKKISTAQGVFQRTTVKGDHMVRKKGKKM